MEARAYTRTNQSGFAFPTHLRVSHIAASAPRATVTLSSQDLERGNPERFNGRFGDGTGKWRVRVESADERAIFVLGLVANRDGSLHNVSR